MTVTSSPHVEILPHVLAVHPCGIFATCATRCMRWLFTGGSDGTIRKFDFFSSMNGKVKLTQTQMHGLPDSVTKLGVILGQWENEERPPLNQPAGEEEEAEEEEDPTKSKISPVYAMDVHSEAVWLAAGLQSGAINLYTVRHDQGTCFHVLRGHGGPVSTVKILPGETSLLTGSWDRNLMMWDLNTGAAVRSFEGHSSQITCTDVYGQQDQCLFASSSYNGECMIWDHRQSNVAINILQNETSSTIPPWCLSLCWSTDGQKIYVGRRNELVEEWDVIGGKKIRDLKFPLNSGFVSCVRAMHDGKSLLCASVDNIRMWNLETSTSNDRSVPFQIVPGHHGSMISSLLLSNDGRFMVSASGNRGFQGYYETSNCFFYVIK